MTDPARDTPTATAAATAASSCTGFGLALIGPGRVGGSLARAARAAGLDPRLAGRAESIEAARQADVVLLCVPDAAITATAAELAAAGVRPALLGHTSGATPLTALAPLADSGCHTFSLHPLQTIPDDSTDLDGCPVAVAGSTPQALARARELAGLLGMRPFEVDEARRAEYHAAASMASNFLVALEESAAELMAAAGVADGRELLAPIVTRSAQNWAHDGAAALTGPIARGDRATVDRHREAIRRSAPALLGLYEALAERTEAVAQPAAGQA